jgi:DUF1680 family protein
MRLSGAFRDGEPIAISGTAVPSVLLGAEVEPAGTVATSSTDLWPYGTYEAAAAPAPASPEQVTITAIPYFAWANRDYGAMRIWLRARG